MRFHRLLCQAASASFAVVITFLPFTVEAQSTRVATTPSMGWNSWNHFGDRVNDADVRAAADAMVASGMRDAGYIYVNVDDTWEAERDARGNIHPVPHGRDSLPTTY